MQLNGDIEPFDKYYEEGVPIFRKMTTSKAELCIYRRLKKVNSPDVVKIYRIGKNYVDIEKVNPRYMLTLNAKRMEATILRLKALLQQNGILYIDWKWDNFGVINNRYKLYDFDASGIIHPQTKKWCIEAPHYYKYNECVEAGCRTPLEIDDCAFANFYKEVIVYKSRQTKTPRPSTW